MDQTKLWVIFLVLFCALLGGIGQVLLKMGSNVVGSSLWSWIANAYLAGGLFLYGVSAVLFIVALKHGKLSILYPLIATSYVWVAVLSHYFLRESFELTQWLGVVLILGGVAFIVF